MLSSISDRVSIYEVSPRDGLQNEKVVVSVGDKIRLIEALIASGLRRIEATSFVSPKWIPQLADADEVAAQAARLVNENPGLSLSALCPNEKGIERALQSKIGEIAVFVSSSETHNKKNVNKTIDDTLAGFVPVAEAAKEHGLKLRGYVSTVWGCPYEGEVSIEASLRVARRLLQLGCYEISLGDTIGVGTPKQTQRIVDAFLAEFQSRELAMHMHDTRGTALANVLVGLDRGIRTFDASVGGVGGCPYAPGAAGNVATEDLVFMLEGMGVETGVDLERLWRAGVLAEELLQRPLPGKVHRAGVSKVSKRDA